MTTEATMRAVTQQSLGEPDVLVVADHPRPEPRTNEILVRVRAASVNPTDWKHRENGGFLGQPPFVLGWDLSGVVEAVGIGATSSEFRTPCLAMSARSESQSCMPEGCTPSHMSNCRTPLDTGLPS